MLTLFHAPQSRSTVILALIHEMGIADWVDVKIVTIPRIDGSGGRDPANPHPEGKVPALVHDGHVITERAAIILHLTSLFPGHAAPAVGSAAWGEFLTWLTWYQGVFEPVLIFEAAGLTHPWLEVTFRDHKAAARRLRAALERGPWLMGAEFSAVDLLLHTPYAWFKDATPDDPLIRDWVARCMARPAQKLANAADGAAMAA
jgi:glutathione S-transferase